MQFKFSTTKTDKTYVFGQGFGELAMGHRLYTQLVDDLPFDVGLVVDLPDTHQVPLADDVDQQQQELLCDDHCLTNQVFYGLHLVVVLPVEGGGEQFFFNE